MDCVPVKLPVIGIAAIDNQHQHLLEMVNRLHEKSFFSRAEVAESLEEFSNYAVTHFDDEEFFMENINFPGIEQHKAVHLVLREKVDEFNCRFESGEEAKSLTGELKDWFSNWLVTHITHMDSAAGTFFQNAHRGK
ncbi:MAG: hemerythrin family protein [Lentisphaerae bacterium]|nr:hemerythrin family protein [Lentisphaerota bacterium]MCP4102033.1 hemerythrin family protein [Lentisphaerota bacterium]